ncbi:MAG: TlpA disulfide reductase family protein [Campylobacterota bacterium]|nr:TlpA disulfide reductase family protein [Campylobacterota bacterium]
MSKILLLSSLMAFSLLFTACSEDKTQAEDANSMLSTNEFVLTSLANTQHTVTKGTDGFSVKGSEKKVILLDIFATWCPPCQAEASHLSALQKKYKDSLLILGISIEEGIKNEKLQDFRNQYDANYTLVNSSENRRLVNAVASKLKVGRNFGIPLMAMYKDGKLVNFYQGAVEEEFIESDIKKALGK